MNTLSSAMVNRQVFMLFVNIQVATVCTIYSRHLKGTGTNAIQKLRQLDKMLLLFKPLMVSEVYIF